MSSDSPTCAVLRSKVPDSWDVLPLADVTDFQEGPGILAKDFTELGVPLLRLRNMEGARVTLSGSNFLDPRKVEKKWAHFALSEGDFLISTSASLGRVSVVGAEAEGAIAYTGIIRFRSRSKKLDHSYLRAFLSSAAFVEQAEQMATGSVIKHFGPSHLKQMAIVLPSLEEQSQIAGIFDVLDHRIALLRETNATLEAIAHALFKSWFVDFDPVRARQEGRAPDGMDEATAALFPDGFDEAETGSVPRGWGTGTLANLADLNPESWTSKIQPETIQYVDLANVKDNEIDEVTIFAFDDAPSRARRVLRVGDTVVGTVRPGNRSFAYIYHATNNLTGSTGFAVLRPRDQNSEEFLFIAATRDASIEHLAHVADGGAYPAVRPEVVASLKTVLPHRDVLDAFHSLAGPIFLLVGENKSRVRTLTTLRDVLLPRLISGQLRLPEATDPMKHAA